MVGWEIKKKTIVKVVGKKLIWEEGIGWMLIFIYVLINNFKWGIGWDGDLV